jgi:phosphoribosylanthranilate isomerase
MSLKVKVKVGRVTNLSEARYCAGMGVDLLGFPVGENGLKPEQYRQMIDWVAGPEFVLEVHQSPSLDLRYITENYPAHYVEIGLRQLDWLKDESLQFIVALTTEQWHKLKLDKKNVKFVEILDWKGEKIESNIPVLLSVESLGDVLKTGHGISLIGSDEEKPGIKDYSKIADILEALETE